MLHVGNQRLVIVTGYKRCKEGLVDKGAFFANRPSWLYVLFQIFHAKGKSLKFALCHVCFVFICTHKVS